MGRPILAVIAAAALTAAGLWIGAGWVMPQQLRGTVGDGSGSARTRAWFRTTGFNGPEYDAATGRQFSWTGSRARLILPELSRTQAYRLGLRVTAGRGPDLPPPPEIVVTVDGVERARLQTSNTASDVTVEIPPSIQSRLIVAIDVSNTFTPGPQDPRTLGVIVDDVSIAPAGGRFRPTWRILALATFASAALAGAVLLCGVGFGWSIAAGALVSGTVTWLLLVDGAFLGAFAEAVAQIATGGLAAGALVALGRAFFPASAVANDWPLAAALAILAVTLKLALFAHPQATIGDALFHVHRAQAVRAGNYFFTSITPKPYFEFPYPVALYVTALPLWRWFTGELELAHLLRGLAILADALVGFAFFFPLRRAAGRAAAFAFAILWPFVPISAQALSAANLTNVFGQGLFGLAMGVLLWMAASGRASVLNVATATILLAASFLSHFSTATVGIPIVGLVAIGLIVAGPSDRRRVGGWILAAIIAAAAVSYVTYYSHFHDVYRTTVARVRANEGQGDLRSLAAPLDVKAQRWRYETGLNFGWPLLAGAIGGACVIGLRRRREGIAVALGAWTVAWAAFSALGIFTPIELRANLAAAPLLTALAATAVGALATRSAIWAAAAVTLSGFAAWRGALVLAGCLGLGGG